MVARNFQISGRWPKFNLPNQTLGGGGFGLVMGAGSRRIMQMGFETVLVIRRARETRLIPPVSDRQVYRFNFSPPPADGDETLHRNHAGESLKRSAIATTVLLLTILALPGARNERASTEAFLEVYRVLQHPRCQNCHPEGDSPLHGDDSHPHAFDVKRGEDGHGLADARCVKCHRAYNQFGEHQPPGASHPPGSKQPAGTPRWHLPSARMPLTFQGRSAARLCRQLLNPGTNGGLRPEALIAHTVHDPFVAWAWNPGDGRTKPPGSHEQFAAAVRAWIEQGPACPAE